MGVAVVGGLSLLGAACGSTSTAKPAASASTLPPVTAGPTTAALVTTPPNTAALPTTTAPITVTPTTLPATPTTIAPAAQHQQQLQACEESDYANDYAAAVPVFQQTIGRAPTQAEVIWISRCSQGPEEGAWAGTVGTGRHGAPPWSGPVWTLPVQVPRLRPLRRQRHAPAQRPAARGGVLHRGPHRDGDQGLRPLPGRCPPNGHSGSRPRLWGPWINPRRRRPSRTPISTTCGELVA